MDEDSPLFVPYIRDPSALRTAILDPNAVAQEKGLEAALAFIEYGGKQAASKATDAFVSAVRDKGLWGATRAGTRKAAVELCLVLIECDDAAEGVLTAATTEGLKSKQPKAVAGAVITMLEMIRSV